MNNFYISSFIVLPLTIVTLLAYLAPLLTIVMLAAVAIYLAVEIIRK